MVAVVLDGDPQFGDCLAWSASSSSINDPRRICGLGENQDRRFALVLQIRRREMIGRERYGDPAEAVTDLEYYCPL